MSGFKDILRETTLSSVPSTRAVNAPIEGTNVIKERTGAAASGTTSLVVDGGTQGIRVGDIVVGAGIPAATTVSAVNHDTSTVTLSATTTAALTATTATVPGTKVTFLASSHTTGTASASSTSLVVADATNIAVGDAVFGTGIASGATVSAISGTTVTLSANTTAAISGGEINFVDADGLGAQVLNNGAVAAGATTIVVDANTNISVGDIVEVAGVTAGTTVTNVKWNYNNYKCSYYCCYSR